MALRAAALLLALTFGVAAAPVGFAADWKLAGGALFARGSPVTAAEQPASIGDVVATPDQPFAAAVALAAKRHGLDPKLLHAVVIVESAYRADAHSIAGAVGLTQLMPRTAIDLGVSDRLDVEQNLEGGASYLAAQLNRFGDLRSALAAYNAGPGRLNRRGDVPHIKETQAYVGAVIECYLALTAGRAVRSSKGCTTRHPIVSDQYRPDATIFVSPSTAPLS